MIKTSILKKVSAAALFLASGIVAANAEGSLSVDNVFIAPGETKTVTVNLDNENAITFLQCFIELPEGLSMVPAGQVPEDTTVTLMKSEPTERTSEISKVQVTQNARQVSEGGNQYTLFIYDFPLGKDKIRCCDGDAIISFDITASKDFKADMAQIKITPIDVQGEDIPAMAANVINSDGSNVVTLTPAEDEISLASGEEDTITLNLANKAPLFSYITYVTLPDGVDFVSATPVEGLDGEIATKVMDDGSIRLFFVPALSLDNTITADYGLLANLVVKADSDVPAGSVVSVAGFDGMDNQKVHYYADKLNITVKEKVTGVSTVETEGKLVDVYTTDGVLVKRNVKAGEAVKGLAKGIYIVGGKKVLVK